MTNKGRTPNDEEIAKIADDFANREFSNDELATIKKTRRRTPTIGDTAAEVVTFRAPPTYKERIRERAEAEHTSESQVIRDALDAYLLTAK